jgi:hypothetical protein
MVVAAGMGEGRAQLGVAQRADQRHQAAQRPGQEHPARAAGHARYQGRRLEDAGTDHHADDQRDRFAQTEQRAGSIGMVGCCGHGGGKVAHLPVRPPRPSRVPAAVID